MGCTPVSSTKADQPAVKESSPTKKEGKEEGSKAPIPAPAKPAGIGLSISSFVNEIKEDIRKNYDFACELGKGNAFPQKTIRHVRNRL